MNILYIAGESSNWVVNLCNEFCKQGHKVTCVVQSLDEYDKENPIAIHNDLTRINVTYEELFTGKTIINILNPYILKNKYDVIFGSHAPTAPMIQYLGETYKIPYGVMLLDIPTDLMRVQRPRMQQWTRWFDNMEYADAIIFNTKISRDEYEKYTGQYFDDRYVIPYAINMPEGFDLSGIKKKGDYVISVCRLTGIKNCKNIARALSLLDSPKKYVAIGRISVQEEFNIIKDTCEKNGVEFIHYPMVSEQKKFELIRDSSMLIYPQDTEYIGGLSPFEGMYCGKPVIVKDYKVSRDLYNDFAYYFDGTDLDLAKKIAFVHNCNRDALLLKLEQAYSHTLQMANFNIMAKSMIKIFERIKK